MLIENLEEVRKLTDSFFENSGKEQSMLSENQRKIFADFHKSVEAEEAFDEKTSHMIKVAAAMAFGCYP